MGGPRDVAANASSRPESALEVLATSVSVSSSVACSSVCFSSGSRDPTEANLLGPAASASFAASRTLERMAEVFV